MVDFSIRKPLCNTRKKPLFARLAFAVVLAGLSLSVHAGKITSIPSPVAPDADTRSGVQDRFGGWNLDNVFVNLNGSFDEATGAYVFTDDSDLSYSSDVDDGTGAVLGYVLAKDWPVGEPAGIKIVNDDFDAKRAPNCIMSTSYLEDHLLDSDDPKQVLCSGPFQSHKRYKLAMLSSTAAIDLVFNVEQDDTLRDYQVFQKINNWTDERLQGFTVEVGTGIGADFVPASALTGVGLLRIELVAPGPLAGVLSSCGLLPLRLGGQAEFLARGLAEPATVGQRLVPTDSHHRVVGLVPFGVAPVRWLSDAFLR